MLLKYKKSIVYDDKHFLISYIIIYPLSFAYMRWAKNQEKTPRLLFIGSCGPSQDEDLISPPGPGPSLRAHPGTPP